MHPYRFVFNVIEGQKNQERDLLCNANDDDAAKEWVKSVIKEEIAKLPYCPPRVTGVLFRLELVETFDVDLVSGKNIKT